MTDAEIYERLKPPTTIVVRVGRMRFVAEYPYRGDAKPGCGSKLVARTHRGTEVVEMLTTTCGNSGCSKSVSRNEMLDYIEQSGGKDYPFHTDGQILRVATIDDLNRWSEVQSEISARVKDVRRIVEATGLPMRVVDVEPLLGGEQLTVYFLSEERVDFRELVRQLAAEFQTRIEMRQVGARDEARLVADYERCGQHCCCKNFLKVLKPISMRSAKIQKATLDPLKISGRCGRLMCCLRYEDETYEDLKKRLPKNKSRVGTAEGPGIVVDGKILVQLVLVQLEHDGREIAVPVEELLDPDTCPKPAPAPEPMRAPSGGSRSMKPARPAGAPATPEAADPLRGMSPEDAARKLGDRERRDRGQRSRSEQQDQFRASSADEPAPADDGIEATDMRDAATDAPGGEGTSTGEGEGERRRRRRRRRRGRGEPGDDAGSPAQGERSELPPSAGPAPSDSAPNEATETDGPDDGGGDGGESPETGERTGGSRRRRRRRRRRGGGAGGANGGGSGEPSGPPPTD